MAWQSIEALGNRIHADPADFRPALIRLQQTPPNPLGRRVLWAILIFLAILLVWACIGRLDIVAVAEGKLKLAFADGRKVAEGLIVDSAGHPSTDPGDFYAGGALLTFGGHKGYGLSFAVQALGLLAGAALPQGKVKDYGFLLLVIDPKMTLPGGEFPDHMSGLVEKIKATPRRPGVDEIRVPSERSFREREQRRKEGLVFDRKVVDSLKAL